MSTYEMGAFEALEWAWTILRANNSRNDGDAVYYIREMLSQLGSGNQVNFKQQTDKIKNLA